MKKLSSSPSMAVRVSRGAVALAVLAVIAGCAVIPEPVTKEEVSERVKGDVARMFEGQDPITAPITLDEALARALKYNLDYRLKRMESVLALGLTDYASKDMLPQVLARAGYQERNNDSGGFSRNIIDRVESTVPTTSADRSNSQTSIGFSWNALDFGVSYYRAKQQGDQYLIAEERRRKVVQNLLQDVRASYWRALAAQKLSAQADDVLQRAQTALSRSREAESQKALSPGVALAYQRALLDATSLLSQRRQDLQYAKQELAALMNVPTGVNFEIAQAPEPKLPPMPKDLFKLEELALMQRPELREEDLRKRISAAEARKQILSVLPNLTFNLGRQNDTNSLLYSNTWSEGGVNLAWNLMRLAALPAMKDAQAAQTSVDDMRRAALSMAILTQARLGAERYRMALHDHELAVQAAQVDQRLASFTKANVTARLESELEAIRTQARAVLGSFQQANAYSSAQIAYGRLYNALGFDPLADDFASNDLGELKQRMKAYLDATDKDAYALSSQLMGQYATLAVKVTGLEDAPQNIRLTALTKDVLKRYDVAVDPQSPHQLEVSIRYTPAGAGMSRMQWILTLNNRSDKVSKSKVLNFDALVYSDGRPSVMETALSSALSARMDEIKQWMRS